MKKNVDKQTKLAAKTLADLKNKYGISPADAAEMKDACEQLFAENILLETVRVLGEIGQMQNTFQKYDKAKFQLEWINNQLSRKFVKPGIKREALARL